MGLFQLGDFKLHSGSKSRWKIDCDALTDEDIEALALMITEIVHPFGSVEGVPTGGLRLAKALEKYIPSTNRQNVHLIVDDVLTTGRSIEEVAESHKGLGPAGRPAILGAVIFARGKCPQWVTPLFQMKG